jgi:hypothetical protein
MARVEGGGGAGAAEGVVRAKERVACTTILVQLHILYTNTTNYTHDDRR